MLILLNFQQLFQNALENCTYVRQLITLVHIMHADIHSNSYSMYLIYYIDVRFSPTIKRCSFLENRA
jgi:hypothetical protein